jgi:hypothetical protein
MNNFYSANGSINKYKIIEQFNDPTEGISIISHLIESEKYKNKIKELENRVNNINNIITDKINEVKRLLPFDNDKYSKIISKTSTGWEVLEDDIYIDIEFDGKFDNNPQILTELILTNNYDINLVKSISNISGEGFKVSIKLNNFNIDDFNIVNNTNFTDKFDFVKNSLSLNYIAIG